MPQDEINQPLHQAIQLYQAGRLDDAARLCTDVVARDPNNAAALNLLGTIRLQGGNLEIALIHLQKAIALNPSVADYRSNLGAALRVAGRFEEAELQCRTAIKLKPDFASAHNNLGNALQEQCKWPEAMQNYGRSVALDPSSANAHWNYARSLLILGHWKEGWKEFEWRLKIPQLGINRDFPQPLWDGSHFSGKTLLVWAEGGFGDTLNFFRLIPAVIERGGKVILECQEPLVPLIKSSAQLDQVIARGQPLPKFDLQIPLLSLANIFGITVENVPNKVPYLFVPKEQSQRWKAQLGGESKLRVGLVWSGSKYTSGELRTRTVEVFAPLAEIPKTKFFSLQKGPDSRQLPPAGMDWADFTADLNDFADTAALIDNLDLIITIDTSVAHLAGALAKPVWVLIPFQNDFRWLLDRQDTPWYPTMHLFRQKYRQNWPDVIDPIRSKLILTAAARTST